MPATSPARLPVVRLGSPGELAAAVPVLCGFVPTESLVVVSLHGRRSRVGLTMRVDLPPPELGPALAAEVGTRLRADGARSALVVVHTEAPDAAGLLPRARLVDDVAERLREVGVDLADALLVRAERWWSYRCSSPACCPPEGTPLDAAAAPAVQAVTAAHALDGRAVLASREALAAQVAPPRDDLGLLAQRLRHADAVRERRVRAEGRAVVGREGLRAWRRALDRGPDAPAELGPQAAAVLAVSLRDVLVRDAVLTWALEDDVALLAVLLELARRTVPPFDAPVCALLAWVAHLRGDGGLANVALDRALASCPRYSLAEHARAMLDGQVRPAVVRRLLGDVRTALGREHPWTAVRAQ